MRNFTNASDAWSRLVGSQTPAEFMANSARDASPIEASRAYMAEIRSAGAGLGSFDDAAIDEAACLLADHIEDAEEDAAIAAARR